MNTLARWRMVRDDDRRPRMGLGQPAFKPLGVSATQGDGIIGREQSWYGLVHMDYAEITHEPLRFQHCQRTLLAIRPKHEIRPQRGPQKTHAFDDDLIIVEYVNSRSGTQFFE